MREEGKVQAGVPGDEVSHLQEPLPYPWQEPGQALSRCPALVVPSSSVPYGKHPTDSPAVTPFRTGKGAWQG